MTRSIKAFSKVVTSTEVPELKLEIQESGAWSIRFRDCSLVDTTNEPIAYGMKQLDTAIAAVLWEREYRRRENG